MKTQIMCTCTLYKMQIGKKIKMLRALKGFTQNELAGKINKTRALVSHIEQTGKVNNYTLTAILKALNITSEDFEKFDNKEVVKAKPYGSHSDDELNILKERVENYQKENKTLKELIASQKKIISIIEKSKGKK